METQRYTVDICIVDQYGSLLYDSETLRDIPIEGIRFLANLHTIDPDLEWESDGTKLGAWDYLIAAGYLTY